MKKTIVFLTLASVLMAAVPPNGAQLTVRNFYDGSSNLIYSCIAAQNQAMSTWSVADSTLTSIAVSSNVATVTVSSSSGVYVGMRITVAGSSTSALNGTWTVTSDTPTGTTFTFAVTTADVTSATAAMTVSTKWPLDNASVWKVLVLRWSGSLNTNVVEAGTESSGYAQKCSLRANY